ncbi:LacI family DNA-binding transcriptional regulator [Ohessyouella blattaphilus]|uniref:LacI family transcriptional regulator n=1 Tax=Ohessyouella blattaphilus TaxID=2949333 RepID=A0ABT1EKQ9_9FIRM|nr:LacI family DNA-binding transcriptional regulator [Ohessyouella blattaphilus]MCP1110352.1 LacI family transcriptional regulator [Ohessyouella blattaphilus]MCR8563746.1 LacI family transcriptional regulator [Ohessyouella blattaphilus]
MITIFDVAKEANVSKSTVSRVVNNDPSVKDDTRVKVQAAIKKLNYAPSFFAKGIRTGKTKTIALLVPEYTNMFYGEMFNGVEDMAFKKGYVVVVCNTGNATSEKEYINKLLERNVDGIIYNTYNASKSTINFLEKLSQETPVVVMDELLGRNSNLNCVYTDGYNSSREAVHYLTKKGIKEIGYVKNNKSIQATKYRYQGFLQGLKECRLKYKKEYIYECTEEAKSNYMKAGKKAGEYFLSLQRKPSAIMTDIDLLAIGCSTQLIANGIKIPEEISIVGFDNIELGEISHPALTTIAQPTREMGCKAAEIIIDQLEGSERQVEKMVFTGELIVRDTTI